MTVTIYPVRLFGGRDLAVSYDTGAGTLAILGVSISLSSLSAALQTQWTSAAASITDPNFSTSRAPFGGSNVQAAVGAILDAQPTWRSSVQAALVTVTAEQTLNGQVAGVDTWNR